MVRSELVSHPKHAADTMLAALHAVTEGELFPTAGLETPDSKCDLPHVIGRAVKVDARSALVNAFAFGGANASLVVERAS